MIRRTLPSLLALTILAACDRGTDGPQYVGTAACGECHAEALDAWRDSHHDLAMQEATEATVLGDFDDATFDYAGTTTTFFRRDGAFWVRADGPDGTLDEFPVRYTFGVTPLQQYLLELPDGRLQALSVMWDARAAAEGGQRWYHLYPDEAVTATDELHWTRRSQNWNRACATCHSTNLVKGYDADSDTYRTTWSDLDVGCEACHGPGSDHVAWADRDEPFVPGATGLVVLRDPSAAWVFDPDNSIARPLAEAPDRTEIETCAPCHARRIQLTEDHRPGDPFLDSHVPNLLIDRLYFDDGQIDDEVYVYGSFLQSRMYQMGVTCSDCHDPHSLTLRADGNDVCAQCHRTEVYDTPEHHLHPADSDGAACVACHMPARTYMGVDARRDHSMRIPRPDLSVSLGTPNACSGCHTDQTARWARDVLAQAGVEPRAHFATALAAARAREPDADKLLLSLATQDTLPAIVRATLVDELRRSPSRPTLQAARRAVDDPDPLVRVAGLRTLEIVGPEQRYQIAEHRLRDTVLAVRAEAGRVMAAMPLSSMTPSQRAVLDSAVETYLRIQELDADHPVSYVNRGLVLSVRERLPEAEAAYRAAIALDASWVPAYANLADLYRSLDREVEAQAVLLEGIGAVPDPAPLHHALGLSYVRLEQMEDAIAQLRLASEAAPDNARFLFVYAVALHDLGRSREALDLLEAFLVTHPNDPDVVFLTGSIYGQLGDLDRAEAWARHLKTIEPFRERADILLEDIATLRRRSR